MKINMNLIYPSIIATALILSISSCKQDSIVFPEQIEADDNNGGTDRGPVKQNTFKVITDDDEKVKFDLSNVDKERVKTLFFSHNADGEKVDTEITNFDDLYVISNLPIRQVSQVEVWAVGHNDLLSQKYSYAVTPLPFPATIVSEGLSIKSEVFSATLTIFNRSRANATLFYKIDDAQQFVELDLPSPTPELDIELGALTSGNHTITYYVVDVNGGQSKEITQTFHVYNLSKIAKNELSAEVSSTETNEGTANGMASSLLDDDIQTYWHSTWWPNSLEYPHWIIVDLGKERNFGAIEMIRRHNNTTGGFKNFRIEYSSNKTSWTTLADNLVFNSADSPAAFQRFVTKTVNTRYIRIYITAPWGSSASTHLAEINVFEAI